MGEMQSLVEKAFCFCFVVQDEWEDLMKIGKIKLRSDKETIRISIFLNLKGPNLTPL